MLLDIHGIFGSYNAPVVENVVLNYNGEDFEGFCVSKPVDITLTLSLIGGAMRLVIKGDVVVEAECARCLDPVSQVFTIDREFDIKDEDCLCEEPDLPFTKDGKLDVRVLVYQELLMEVPTALLCSDECKGLCPVCGNKKALGCNCSVDTTDDRLSILKQLLS